MSSLFFSTTHPQAADAAGERLRFVSTAWVQRVSLTNSLQAVVTRVDSAELWGPAYDPASGVHIWLGGRVCFEESDWVRAESLPYDGGLACRLLIELWLKHGEALPKVVNGAFAIVVHDLPNRLLHLFTDAMGIYPLYQATGEGIAVCSHPDVLADFLKEEGKPCDLNLDTLAEFLATGTSVQPSTYYRQIYQLEPASHYLWKLDSQASEAIRKTWWEPAYLHDEPSHDAESLAEELAAALGNAARRRTLSRLGKPVVFLSGGADSRAALFGASDPSLVTAFTLCDEINPEVKTAQKLAKTAGAAHIVFKRDLDYYPRGGESSMKIAGGMWSLADAHYTEAAPQISALNAGVILTGCYADYMFKGLLINRQHRKMFGRNLPLYDIGKFNHEYYQPLVNIAPAWNKRVKIRLNNRVSENLQRNYQSNILRVEDLRLRPLSREPDVSGRLYLWRTQPWDPFLMDKDVLAVYGKMSPECKINGIIFGKAVGKIIGPEGRKIPNNNYGTPVNAGESKRVFWFLHAVVKRKLQNLSRSKAELNGLATPGSWPNHAYVVANSPVIRSIWNEMSLEHRTLFKEILGEDPVATSLSDWSVHNLMLFNRIISIHLWMKSRNI